MYTRCHARACSLDLNGVGRCVEAISCLPHPPPVAPGQARNTSQAHQAWCVGHLTWSFTDAKVSFLFGSDHCLRSMFSRGRKSPGGPRFGGLSWYRSHGSTQLSDSSIDILPWLAAVFCMLNVLHCFTVQRWCLSGLAEARRELRQGRPVRVPKQNCRLVRLVESHQKG